MRFGHKVVHSTCVFSEHISPMSCLRAAYSCFVGETMLVRAYFSVQLAERYFLDKHGHQEPCSLLRKPPEKYAELSAGSKNKGAPAAGSVTLDAFNKSRGEKRRAIENAASTTQSSMEQDRGSTLHQLPRVSYEMHQMHLKIPIGTALRVSRDNDT
jgi:hypothetical protein